MNDHPRISETTKRKVREKAKELGYMVFHHARVLRTQKTFTIGIIVPDIRNPFFLDFLYGVEKILFPRKYKILLSMSNENVEKEKQYIEWLVEHGTDGILVSPAFDEDGKGNLNLLTKVKGMGIPVVLYDRLYEDRPKNFDSVTIDNFGAVFDVIKYLHSKGHRDIGMILANGKIYTMKKRYEGYLEGCRNLKMNCRRALDISDIFDHQEFKKICNYISKEPMSAVIATSHFVTKEIYRCVKSLGWKIPKDISVVGFDDIDENELFNPPVTVIKQPVSLIGKAAATLLLERVDKDNSPLQSVVFKAELIERSSVKNITK